MEETKEASQTIQTPAKPLPEFMTAESYVAPGEENDVRVAKRNVGTFERFL